jgi:putative glycosyltransferase (TIGR04372 family)
MFFYGAPGHMLPETDILLRKLLVDPQLKQSSPIFFLPPSDFAVVISDLVKALGHTVVLDPNAPQLAREIQLFYPELAVDVGIAHFRLTTPPGARGPVATSSPLNFAWALKRHEFIQQWISIHKLWNATRGKFPLREALDKLPCAPAFQNHLLKGKYAVLQRKNSVINGTSRVLTDDYYRPTLELLRDHGYSIILGGREPMLDIFKEFGVYDYPSSKFVSARNDFFLFRHADFGIVSPSGASFFCDTLGIPACQYGPWHLLPQTSEKTITVPARLKKRNAPNILTFTEQIATFFEMYDEARGPGHFYADRVEDIQPTPEDICAGVRELLDEKLRTSAVAQEQATKLRELDKGGVWEFNGSRMSTTFLTNHPEYLK